MNTNISDILGQINNTNKNVSGASVKQLTSIQPFYLVWTNYISGSILTNDRANMAKTAATFCGLATKVAMYVWEQRDFEGDFYSFINQFSYALKFRYPNVTDLNDIDFNEIAGLAYTICLNSDEVMDVFEKVNDIDVSNLLTSSSEETSGMKKMRTEKKAA